MSISVTVPGVSNSSHVYSTITLQYQTAQNANIAISLLSQIYAAAASGTLGVQNDNDSEGVTTGTATPTVFEWTIGDQPTITGGGGVQNNGTTEGTVPAAISGQTFDTIIDAYTSGQAEIVNAAGQTNDLVVAGGDLHFYTEGGSGTIISGAGGNFIQTATSGEGDWVVFFDGGDNTVNANSGNFFIDDGNASTTGANLIFLGTGNSTVFSWGTDTIIGGSNGGNNIVAAFTSGTQYWADSGNNAFINVGGADTFVGGTGNDTVYALANASQGGGLYFGGSGTMLLAQAANNSSTVVSGSGNATVWANPGSDGLYFVGPGNFAMVAGGSDTVVAGPGASPAVIYGLGNSADVTLYGTDNGNIFIAGTGSATLNAAGASGDNMYYSGGSSSSADSITAGSGNDTLVLGMGSNTLTGGAGANEFAVINGSAGGNELIVGWNSTDTLALTGYGALGNNGLPTGASESGNMLMLSDGTKITFAGLTNLNGVHITSS